MNPSTDEGRALLALVADMGGQGIDPMAGARWRELGRLVLALEARSSHSDVSADLRAAAQAFVDAFDKMWETADDDNILVTADVDAAIAAERALEAALAVPSAGAGIRDDRE